MDLSTLDSKLGTIISSDYSIVLRSSHTRESNKIIVWDPSPCSLSSSTYMSFKESIKARGNRHYTFSGTIPYVDFCIALLCTTRYSLNHENVTNSTSRMFLAAWRTIDIVSNTAPEADVREWVCKHLKNRSAEGYARSFGMAIDGNILINRSSNSGYSKYSEDLQARLDLATFSGDVVDIPHDEECRDATSITVPGSTNVAYSQLSNLRIVFTDMIDDSYE